MNHLVPYAKRAALIAPLLMAVGWFAVAMLAIFFRADMVTEPVGETQLTSATMELPEQAELVSVPAFSRPLQGLPADSRVTQNAPAAPVPDAIDANVPTPDPPPPDAGIPTSTAATAPVETVSPSGVSTTTPPTATEAPAALGPSGDKSEPVYP